MKRICILLLAALALLMTACGKTEEAEGFVPRLDTQAEITIEMQDFSEIMRLLTL